MLKPTGFWSYTTSDETSARGKLSQLRALLAAELQQQVGREPKVNIFQDVVAIPPGAEWDVQIRRAIEDSSFVIPIITPGFLQSEWCCREVSLFREREASLGVKFLVFPLHYVDVDHVNGSDPRQCHDPEVLTFLRSRQWTDFRHLRLRNQDSEAVAVLLEGLARGLLRALRDAASEQERVEAERVRNQADRLAKEAKAAQAAERQREQEQAHEASAREDAARARELERKRAEAAAFTAEEARRKQTAKMEKIKNEAINLSDKSAPAKRFTARLKDEIGPALASFSLAGGSFWVAYILSGETIYSRLFTNLLTTVSYLTSYNLFDTKFYHNLSTYASTGEQLAFGIKVLVVGFFILLGVFGLVAGILWLIGRPKTTDTQGQSDK